MNSRKIISWAKKDIIVGLSFAIWLFIIAWTLLALIPCYMLYLFIPALKFSIGLLFGFIVISPLMCKLFPYFKKLYLGYKQETIDSLVDLINSDDEDE